MKKASPLYMVSYDLNFNWKKCLYLMPDHILNRLGSLRDTSEKKKKDRIHGY